MSDALTTVALGLGLPNRFKVVPNRSPGSGKPNREPKTSNAVPETQLKKGIDRKVTRVVISQGSPNGDWGSLKTR